MKIVHIHDRIPTAEYFTHHTDSILFYDRNGVKFLFKKNTVIGSSKEDWLAMGFTKWLDEK